MDLIRFDPGALPGHDDQVLIDELFLSQQPHLAKAASKKVWLPYPAVSSTEHSTEPV